MSKVITRSVPEVYQLWLDALRSVKYKQTDRALKGYLHNGQKAFCCLGVVCDLAAKDGGEKWDDTWYKDQQGQLPMIIRKFLKITEKQEETLITLNDDKRFNFKQIADFIETKIMPKALKKSKVMS